MQVKVPEEVLGVKEWECEVISNKNVATFIKEFIVQLPKGEHMAFIPGIFRQQRPIARDGQRRHTEEQGYV